MTIQTNNEIIQKCSEFFALADIEIRPCSQFQIVLHALALDMSRTKYILVVGRFECDINLYGCNVKVDISDLQRAYQPKN